MALCSQDLKGHLINLGPHCLLGVLVIEPTCVGKLRRKISSYVDGGLSGGSHVPRPGSEDPHRFEWKFLNNALSIIYMDSL